MKISINNKTKLPFKIIGQVIDDYRIFKNEIRKEDYVVFDIKDSLYKMSIVVKKKTISFTIVEFDVEARKISTKGLKFPQLPKMKRSDKK